MAHMVETMVSVREVPWHGLGQIVQDKLTATEAITAAGLDWEVELRPLFLGDGTPADAYVVTRDIDGQQYGIVTDKYVPLQNEEAFRFFDGLVADGSAKYDTAGSLDNGRTIWMTAQPKDGAWSLGGGRDQVTTYLLLTNSHSGRRAVRAAVTPIRVVCMNTLNYGLQKAQRTWSVVHTRQMERNLLQGRRALGITFNYMDAFTEEANRLIDEEMSNAAYARFVRELSESLEWSDKTKERHLPRLMEAWYAPGVTLADVVGTQWGALQVVSEYFEHTGEYLHENADATLRRSFDTRSTASKTRQASYALLS